MQVIRRLKTIPFALAGFWAIGVSLYLLLTPATIATARSVAGTPGVVEHGTRQVSWYEVQGLNGVFILFLFALLFSGTWFFAYRARYGFAGLLSVFAISLIVLGALTIGLLYFPSAIAVVFGWLLLGLVRLLELRSTTSA